MLVLVFTGISICVVGISVLEVVASSLFISEGTYQFPVGVRAPLKRDNRPVEMKQGAPLEFQWGSLVVLEDSSLHVAWVFLSSCSALVSSSPVTVGAPL